LHQNPGLVSTTHPPGAFKIDQNIKSIVIPPQPQSQVTLIAKSLFYTLHNNSASLDFLVLA
jgi:hypothetical protein